ncbi:hypothetical protein [Salinibacterium sp. ZJ77]|uniref:WXG100 family type VII secretion target n=1 Tax=Salinibacterium sp. ZJ77 TaxID=2708337 RepID=UPI0014217D02|nr:hypothetical protein [Salinibacterium sp. ZJ77]
MTVQEHDSGDIRSLADALGNLADYTATLESHAQGAAHALTGTWHGIASAEFIQLVSIWAAGATTLRLGAEDLSSWARTAADTYDAAQDATQQIWQA